VNHERPSGRIIVGVPRALRLHFLLLTDLANMRSQDFSKVLTPKLVIDSGAVEQRRNGIGRRDSLAGLAWLRLRLTNLSDG
jgi:hypothetical protein